MSARIDCSFIHRDLQAASLHNNITRKVLNLMLTAVHKKNNRLLHHIHVSSGGRGGGSRGILSKRGLGDFGK